MVKIRAFFITTMFIQLYVGVDISLTCGQRFYEHIIFFFSLGRGIWDHKTTFTPNIVIEVNQPNMEDEFEDTKGVIRILKSKKNR
jgi:hypothetical protein